MRLACLQPSAPALCRFLPKTIDPALAKHHIEYRANMARERLLQGRPVLYFSEAQLKKWREVVEAAGGCPALYTTAAKDAGNKHMSANAVGGTAMQSLSSNVEQIVVLPSSQERAPVQEQTWRESVQRAVAAFAHFQPAFAASLSRYRSGRRCIKESEIVFAIFLASTEQYCNTRLPLAPATSRATEPILPEPLPFNLDSQVKHMPQALARP